MEIKEVKLYDSDSNLLISTTNDNQIISLFDSSFTIGATSSIDINDVNYNVHEVCVNLFDDLTLSIHIYLNFRGLIKDFPRN